VSLTSPQQVVVMEFRETCYGEVANLLQNCYGETGVMDFGLYAAKHCDILQWRHNGHCFK